MNGVPGAVPLTARELKSLHGLTVEQGLRQGYCIEGYVKEYRRAHKAALVQERRALGRPAKMEAVGTFTYQIRKAQITKKMQKATEIREEYKMDIKTVTKLLVCLMESQTFIDMDAAQQGEILEALLPPVRWERNTPVDVLRKRPGNEARKSRWSCSDYEPRRKKVRKKMKYALYDFYEDVQGELICESDDFAEILEAAKLRQQETDGECDLLVMERLPDYVLEELQKEEVTE